MKGNSVTRTRVLMVDDEGDFLKMVAERLALRDYEVFTCFSGRDAIEKIHSTDIDVVVLDLAMPGMDGVETLRELRRVRPLTEVIMLTGHAPVDTAIQGMKLGAFDYLRKPCETEELIAKIQQAYGVKADREERIRAARYRGMNSSSETASGGRKGSPGKEADNSGGFKNEVSCPRR